MASFLGAVCRAMSGEKLLLAIKCVRHAGDSNDGCDGQRGRQLAFAIVEFLPGG